ncbi:MAG: STAS/SEC14 domain-containing protein [Desulfobacterales bacterium]|nr:STAS/SEC14 domain-containing protein [Desulfobacterales bacterium]
MELIGLLPFASKGRSQRVRWFNFFSEAKAKIELYGNIVIYEEIVSFGGIEFKAIIEEFKYLFEVGISNIDKMAVVTDKKWIGKIVGAEDKIFKSIDMKAFSTEEKDNAIEFLKNA